MPNWVYNSMSVSGTRKDLLAFAEKASQRHTTYWLTEPWVRNEDGTNTRVPDEERKIEEELTPESPMSFWNFVKPEDEELPYYFGNKVKEEDKPDESLSHEEQLAKSLTFSGSGWYDWNIRNWGCKWDASEEELDSDLTTLKDTDSISYRFSTAWSPPEGVFRAMVEQHPELDFDFSCEEEQGWGMEWTSSDGGEEGEERSLILTKEWDIPNSHAEHEDLGRSCVCEYEENSDEWYDDCPDKVKDYYVVITKTYRVSTHSAENAWELAQDNDPDEQMELIEDETTLFVKDVNGERLYPTLGDTEGKECKHHFVPCYGGEGKEIVFRGIESCVFCHEERPLETDPKAE